VVIYEYWELNDWIKEQAAKLADEGYVRLAVDRYRGKVAKKVPDDLHAVVEFLGSQSNVKKDCLGSISNGRRILAQPRATGVRLGCGGLSRPETAGQQSRNRNLSGCRPCFWETRQQDAQSRGRRCRLLEAHHHFPRYQAEKMMALNLKNNEP